MERENKFEFTFTPVYWGENEFIFFPTTIEKEGKYISGNDWLPGSFSYLYGVNIFISNGKIILGTEKGETSSNILTIYPIQSNHCVKGLLIHCGLRSNEYVGVFEKRSSYVYPQLWVSQGPSKEV